MRVVSLVPSSTETLLALGADVAACTKYCEQPDLTHVGGTKNPDIEAIVALAPDVVVLDAEENRREDAEALVAAGLDVHVTAVTSVSAGLAAIDDLATLIGVEAPPAAAAAPEPLGVTAFVPIWRRPWMSISEATYGGSLLAHLGCRLTTADAATPYPTIEPDEITAMAPDVILVPSEPYSFDAVHLDELRSLAPSSIVTRVDGQDLFWWGIRTPAAIERLADQIRAALRR